LWAYCSSYLDRGPPIILFEYQTSRAGHHVQSFLTDWQGHLMVDDYSGYKALFNSAAGGGRVELGCFAHVRRKFFDLAKSGSAIAENALIQIALLYAVEKEAQDKNTVERFELRQKKSKPALQNLHAWLIHTRTKTPDGSGTARALD
jgi:transposase